MFYTSTLILTLLINNAISNVAFDKSLKSFSSNELSPNPTKFNSYDNDEPSVSADLSNTEVGTNSDASEDYSESEFKKLQKFQEDEDIDLKSKILFKLLDEGTDEAPMPVVYVEHLKEDAMQSLPSGQASKRSGRYYRRYPWKRQNTRYRAATANRLRGQNTYEADLRYLCVPSRDDIFNLLASLHDTRNGNGQKTVNFCNRKRPAKAIFTNIRFLG